MKITKWLGNQVNQMIGTTPIEDLNSLTMETKTPVVETHTTSTKDNAEEIEKQVVVTTRISLSAEEKMFIEHIIFSAPLFTTRNEILDLILNGIQSISGVKREKSTIKYYIYDSVERKKPENRPYKLIFGLKRYSVEFRQQAIQEAISLGRRETQLKFALPSATLAGWLDKHTLDSTLQKQDDLDAKQLKEEQKHAITTKSSSASSQTVENILQQNTTTVAPKTPQPSPVNEEATKILDTLIQMQNINKELTNKVQLHLKELTTVKKQIMSDFFFKEESCKQLIDMVTATEANIESSLNTLAQVETATQKTRKVRKTTMDSLDTTNTKLRKEGGKLRLRQEQMQQDLQDVVRNIPKIK